MFQDVHVPERGSTMEQQLPVTTSSESDNSLRVSTDELNKEPGGLRD